MNRDFNLYVFSDDANFCSALALECNSYGFELTFFEVRDLQNNFKNNNKIFSVVIIDLDDRELDSMLNMGGKIKIKTDFPVFGITSKISKELQSKSKDYGFDLIFTKRMLLKSLKKVVVHILEV